MHTPRKGAECVSILIYDLTRVIKASVLFDASC